MSPNRLRRSLLLLCLLTLTVGCGEPVAPTPASGDKPAAETEPAPAPHEAAEVGPTWSADTPVGQIVAEAPATVRIFELVKIDYCCGGDRTLAVAAAEQGVDVGVLLGALSIARGQDDETEEIRWDKRPLPELIDHIESTHHVFLRHELPRLAKIIATVARVHAEGHPEMAEVKETYAALHAELIPHLEYEEKTIFPAVRQFVADGEAAALPEALTKMRGEHDKAGAAIHELRRLTNDYAPPEDACNLFKEMLRGLLALEKDTLQHVHLENNVLLRRCMAKR